MSRKTQMQTGKDAIEIIEEATHLLRLLPSNIFASYYLGSLPFILGFLYYWADMSQNAFAYKHIAEYAFAVALLFIWMKCWHAVFASQLKAHISDEPNTRWSIRRIMRLFIVQTAIQPSGLFIIPVAMIATIPFGWTYAFYQNVSVFGDGETDDIKAVFKKSREHALLFPRQNHIILLILTVFGIFVFLNIFIVLFIAPHLLNMLFGIETAFTRAGISTLNTTLLAVSCGIVYMLVDPLVKALYVFRCFYGESLYTGKDLMIELRNYQMSEGIAKY